MGEGANAWQQPRGPGEAGTTPRFGWSLFRPQVLAWLRCKLQQTLAGLRAAAPGSVAGLQEDGARAYALGFMGEYLSQRRLAQLAEACNLVPSGGRGGGDGDGALGVAKEGAGRQRPGSRQLMCTAWHPTRAPAQWPAPP
jgi:hypothetical protein